jgi:glutathione S-transferase
VPKITLYGSRAVPYTEKCWRALVLKKLAFELMEPSGPEDFRRWSPKTGLLPVMTVDEELISDSTEILLRLDVIQPDPPLVSAGPLVAAQQRRLEDWADESFLWCYREWLRIARSSEATAPRPLRPRAHRLLPWLRPEDDGGPRRELELLEGLESRLDVVVNLLGASPFFYSDRSSMADLTIYGMLGSLGRDTIPGAAALIEKRPALLAFMRRVEEATGE